MHFGHAPHVDSPDDLLLMRCRACGWISPEMTRTQVGALGAPWYCDAPGCGERVTSWVRFHPRERAAARQAIGGTSDTN